MRRCDSITERWPELWQGLKRAKQTGRLGHAFLVRSDLPASREDFALALARLAACPASRPDGAPCGECFSCRHLENGSYPELHLLSPVGRAYEIRIGDRLNPEPNTVRYFEEQFFLTSTSGAASKIGIIRDADRMNDEAQNALLKTLEEPPPETVIILVTGNPESLLPTTRSRCQLLSLLENRVEFDFPGREKLFAALHELFFTANGSLQAGEAAAETIISLAASLREAAEEKTDAEWSSRLKEAAAGDPALGKRLEKQYESAAAGAYLKNRAAFLAAIHSYFAQLYLLSSGASSTELPNPEIMGNIEEPVNPEQAAAVLRQAENLLFNLRFNVNEETAFRNFAIQAALSLPAPLSSS